MKVVQCAVFNQSCSSGTVKPASGGVLPKNKRTPLVAAFIVLTLVGECVFEDIALAGRTRAQTRFIQVQGTAVVVANALNHGLRLLNDLLHVGFHGFLASLNGEE